MLHAQLDTRFSVEDLFDRTRYGEFLFRSARALLPLEQAVQASGVIEHFADWPRRQRSTLLLADLSALSRHAPPFEAARPLDACEALGAMYVLEGSRLGARVLLNRTMQSDDAEVRRATRYLGANEPVLWRTFLAALEASPLGADVPRLICGARYAFTRFVEAFDSAS